MELSRHNTSPAFASALLLAGYEGKLKRGTQGLTSFSGLLEALVGSLRNWLGSLHAALHCSTFDAHTYLMALSGQRFANLPRDLPPSRQRRVGCAAGSVVARSPHSPKHAAPTGFLLELGENLT